MRKLVLSLVLALGSTLSSVQAETRLTVDQFITGLVSMSAAKCQNSDDRLAKQYESQGRKAEAHSIRSAEKMICECMPARAKSLRSSLSSTDRGRAVSEAEFTNRYMPEIVNACSAAQLRLTYGEGCGDRFTGRIPHAEKYCSCMSNKLTAVSDAEIAEIAIASADYIPLAAKAQKGGLPAPAKPPALERFGAIETSCRIK